MSGPIECDICVIGAGSAGLSVASGAAQLGVRVVLIEKGEMGGDCLNTGCVPSKALLAAAKSAQNMREAGKFGVQAVADPQVDWSAVMAHVKDVIAQIAPHDSQERFEGLGCTVIREHARFVDSKNVKAGDQTIRAKRFVIATGSRAAVPPIPGLDTVPYLTNETVFDTSERPEHLIVIGGGPIGCEMAQAHRRLGCEVSVLEMASIMPKDDPELVDIVRQRLLAEGIALHEGAQVQSVAQEGSEIVVQTSTGPVRGSHILVAAGRAPNVDGLGLDEAGIVYDKRGIQVDKRLRTSNKKIYAIGDITGGYQFTHQAGYHASLAVQNILFRLPAKVDDSHLPWVTFTEPEVAHVGWQASDLETLDPKGAVLSLPYEGNDRAKAERQTEGVVKVIADRKGRVRGASICGAHAGELLLPWVLATQQKMKLRAFTAIRAPYPTLSELSKYTASSYFTPKLFSDGTRRIVRLLMKLP